MPWRDRDEEKDVVGEVNGVHVTWRTCNERHKSIMRYIGLITVVLLAVLGGGTTVFVCLINGQSVIAEKAEEAVRIATVEGKTAQRDMDYIKEDMREIKTDVGEIKKRQGDIHVSLRLLIQKVDKNGD